MNIAATHTALDLLSDRLAGVPQCSPEASILSSAMTYLQRDLRRDLTGTPAPVDLEDIAYRIKSGFRHNPRYDKADVLVELRELVVRTRR